MATLRKRKQRAARRRAAKNPPFGIIVGGTDCDGMRFAWAVFDLRTRAAAEEAIWEAQRGADGPLYASIVSAERAREWAAEYVPDTRDRFAEAAGY